MALNFFKQRDIDEMDPYDIPDEFINYFDSLSNERKAEIIASRPDLAEGLGYVVSKLQKTTTDNKKEDLSLDTNDLVEIDEGEGSVGVEDENESEEEEDDIFSQISVNLYENVDLDQVLVDGLNPVEALTLQNKTEKCPLHRKKLEKINIKYRSKNGSVYGIVLGLCRECKRLFQEESQLEYVHNALVERNINHTFYDIGLTNLYLRSQQSAYILGAEEKVYVPDTWVEEDPRCPIHEESLYELPCEKEFDGRKVTFTGYFCEHCNKILVRKVVAVDLVDECAMAGVPEIEYETLVKKAPKKVAIKPKELRPDYFIQDGKRVAYNYSHTADCYKLTEEDTVVVSDSVYCNLEGHDTEEVLALIMVKEKRGGRKAYLFMVGYCAQCQKYYMDEEDYKVVYSIGRPEVTILSDIDSDAYQITSGEVFNLERNHLGRLESDIEGEISSIYNQKDYVNPFAVGDYDDGNLAYAKSVSKIKYGPRLEELAGYQPKPYSYRVDITCDGETETYYVGPSDIDLDGKRRVISFNSDFGHELVNYQTLKIKKGGKEYDIKLSRQFDIDHATLFGYANLRTDEDIIFRSGVTDPFLVRVLNMRKKQHNLIDIIATIQENQNKIVDADFRKNIIVQGCAGSGKTMVLLHRLSSLQYKHRYFNFGDQALILTPNDQFSLHIKGLVEGLQIGNIERVSVEQYYMELLRRYTDDFKLDTKLSSEMFVRQDFVDYIYSDQFKADFDIAYANVIEKRNALVEILDNLTDAMGQPKRNINLDDDTKVVQQIRFGAESMEGLLRRHEADVARATEALENILKRKRFLESRIPEVEQFASGIVQESLPRVYAKIAEFVSEKQGNVTQLENQLRDLTTERQRVQGAIIMFGKRARLDQLDKDIKEVERKLNSEKKKTEGDFSVLSLSQEGKTDDEILEWMGQVMLHIKEVQEEIRLCKNSKHEAETFRLELDNDIPAKITAAQEELDKIASITYPEEAPKAIEYLYEKLKAYSLIGTFQLIFDEAVAKFKEEHNVKTINGKYHRYDLYARLLFAMKYFKAVHGTTRFMCIDEGQDLAINEYRLLYELNEKNLTFNIYGDTNQLMKLGRGISDWTELKSAFSAVEFVLNENYRNTNQITRFCNSSFGMDVLQTGVDGAKVREIARRELETEIASLNITTERIAILVPRGVQKKRYLYMDLIPSNIQDIIGDSMDNGYISMMYVDEVKGIEFDKVYVVGNKMTRNEKYIAYTRALSELILVVDDSVEDYDDGSEKKTAPKDMPQKKKTHSGTLTYKNSIQSEDVNSFQAQSTSKILEEQVMSLEIKTEPINALSGVTGGAMQSDSSETLLDAEDMDISTATYQTEISEPLTEINGFRETSTSMPPWELVGPPASLPLVNRVFEFEGVREMPFGYVKVLKASKPKQEKVEALIEFYRTNHKLDKPITVSCQNGEFILEDKFLRYYVARELGLQFVPCEIGTRKENKEKDKLRTLGAVIYDSNENDTGVVEDVTLSSVRVKFSSGAEKWYDINSYYRSGVVSIKDDSVSTKLAEKEPEQNLSTSKLKSIAGSALKEGTFLKGKYTEDEIRDAITSVFATSSKKDSSYKFVFLKAIIDCMYNVEDGFKLSFEQLFQRFTEIYWPVVVGYDLHQKVGVDSLSYVEQILIDAASTYGLGVNSKFTDLTKNQQRDIVKAVKQKCKINVVGALYGDTKGIFYSFSRKDEWIDINPLVFHFLMKNGDEIQEINYKAWAEFMDRVNEPVTEERVRKQYGKPTGTGPSLSHQILKSTFY